jgi:hypothetical protein
VIGRGTCAIVTSIRAVLWSQNTAAPF